MWKKVALTSNYAAAYAAKDVDVDVVAAYPITPQTPVVEKIAEFAANGEIDAEVIPVESEHSAMSAVIGAAATGARVFTATSSQGLALMWELLHIASGLRLPIVMAVAARALSAPISIWCDYSDVMGTRDASWITLIASSAQEVYDSIIQAYRIAEDERVLLPVMVAYDGFIMSHTYEPVLVAEDPKIIREFVPRKKRKYTLNPDNPVTIGAIADPEWYYEIKYQQVAAMKEVHKVVKEVDDEFGKKFDRRYGVIETYMVDDAEIAVLTYGGLYGTVRETVDILRSEGIKVGSIRLRLWRPFPVEDLISVLGSVRGLVVIDRAISYGARISGPVALEVISALYGNELYIPVYSFVAGIGQRAVTERDIKGIVTKALEYLSANKKIPETIYWGVRE